jgi:flagellar basal-body rod protein FlgB
MPIESVLGSDPVGAALRSALDGLAYRQQVTADNIANVDTPGFTARKVDFEDNLRSALADGSLSRGEVTPTTELSTAQRGANGNNVDLANETMTAMQTTFSYQLLSRAVGDRFGLITTAIGGM